MDDFSVFMFQFCLTFISPFLILVPGQFQVISHYLSLLLSVFLGQIPFLLHLSVLHTHTHTEPQTTVLFCKLVSRLLSADPPRRKKRKEIFF